MKKFLVGVIFIIPIVVVVALSATGSIISLTTPVNPEDMVIKDSNNVEIEKDSVIKVDVENFDEFIIIDVLPAITQDKSVVYERVEEVGEGEVELERIGDTNRYKITPIKIGVTKLEIHAKANYSVVKEVTFYVSSDSVDSIDLYNAKGEKLGEFYDIYAGEKLYADVHPIEAVRDNDIQWTSENPNVVTVNANGELKVVSRGVARVKATVVDKDGNTVSQKVDIDTTKAIVASNKLYVSEEITTDYLKNNYALDGDVEVSVVDENVYLFAKGDLSVSVEIIKAKEGEWGILDLPSTLYTRNGGYYPVVGDLLSGEIIDDYTVEVSNAEIITYEPLMGLLVPLKAGNALVSITYNGLSISKEVTVRENPVAFELELSSADQKLGILLTRTWGQYFFDGNGELTNKFNFGLRDKSNAFDVEWSVSEEGLVNVERVENSQDLVIEFLDASRGKSVTLTATLKVNNMLQERVKRSFTFNVNERKAVNVYDWASFKKVYGLNGYEVVLQSDVKVDSTSGLRMDVYGNGFKIDATEMPLVNDGNREWVFDSTWDGNKGHFEWNGDYASGKSLVVEDVVAVGRNDFKEKSDTTEYLLGFILFYSMACPIEIKYCQISQFADGLYLQNGKSLLVEGCIFGENLHDGIHLAYKPGREDKCTVTVRNNIFKQTGGSAIQLVTSEFNERVMDKYFNVDFNVEGFLDVYNWKRRDEFKSIFAESLVPLLGSSIPASVKNLLASAVSKVIDSFIRKPEYDHVFYSYEGEEYASFTFLTVGLIAKVDEGMINNDCTTPLNVYNIPLEDANGTPAGDLAAVSTAIGMIVPSSKPLHITNDCFLICSDFTNGREPEIQPGDPVPNSKELYEKLTSTLK